MKKISTLLLSILFSVASFAQIAGDTIRVKAWDYTSANRDTVVGFLNLPGVTYEKILMRYNMRCKGAQVSTGNDRNKGCGEWDYSCNTFVIDSTKADSLSANVKSHRISGFSGSTFPWSPFPNLYRYRQLQPSPLATVISETGYTVGNGATNVHHPIPTHYYNGRSQYLYTAAELTTAGLTAGNIDAFFLYGNLTISTRLMRVKLKHTTLTQLNSSTPVDTGFTEVFNHNHSIYAFTAGDRVQFHTPFVWDGVSNIMVEFSFNWPNGLSSFPTLKGHTTTLPMGISTWADKHLSFDGTNYVTTPTYNGIGGAADRTVEAWINTKTANKEIINWGSNTTSGKWTVRINGGGQLRLEVNGGYIIGTKIITDSMWHHIAVSFSGTNVNQAILYVDGAIDTISSQQAAVVNTNVNTAPVRIGNGFNNTFFDGKIDNPRIWSAALSQTNIQNWMRKKLDNTHPNYSNLELDLSADQSTANVITDQSPNNRDGNISAHTFWAEIEGKNLFKDFTAFNERPDIKFMRGTYTLSGVVDTFYHSVEQPPNYMDSAIITSNAGTILNDVISYSAQTPLWNANNYITNFNENGNYLSTQVALPFGTINIVDLPYLQRSPMSFQIMSFVTPYGINLDLGPTGKTWTFDMTDFTPVLKGNKRMLMTFGGEWQEEMDVEFLYIVGTPPRNVMDINNIWRTQRSSNYQSINANSVFPPRNITLPSTAASFKIRSEITGHGQEGEFIPRNHHLSIDGGAPKYSWQAWKECAANPVYPQGGTWVYDRAGWCPGMATDLQEFNIDQHVTPGSTHSFDYNVDVASGDSRYIVNHELVSYGTPNHVLDARITDIMNPSTRVEFERENPICRSPKVRIQNTGSTTLTSLDIKYGLNGKAKWTHNWTGNLAFMETADVELNAPVWFWDNLNGPTGNVFEVEIEKPNGGTDEYVLNNKMNSDVVIPNVLPADFVIRYQANNAFTETKIEIIDDQNNVVFSKVAANTALTQDTINLPNGCFSLLISDNDDDGFSWWANNDGSGSLRLNSTSGLFLKNFNGDFGKYIRYNFTVNFPLSYETINGIFDVKIYPNPTDNELLVEATDIDKAQVEIYNIMGKKVNAPSIKNADKLSINTSTLADGMYFMKIQKAEHRATKKFIIKH